MRQVLTLDGQKQREDYRLSDITKARFAGPAGIAPVLEICRKLKDAVEKHDTHPYYHGQVAESLVSALNW